MSNPVEQPHESRLEDLHPNTVLRGILPDCLVTVVGVQWFGSEALELTYKGTKTWRGARGLAEDIRYYGQWMRNEAELRIGNLYPEVELPPSHGGGKANIIAWLWARTVRSPNPAARGTEVPLVRSFWLSTKTGKKAWIHPVVDPSAMRYRFEIHTGNGAPREGTVGRGGGECLLTGSPIPLSYIRQEGQARRIGSRLLAIVADGKGGRIYLPPDEEHVRIARSAPPPENVPDSDMAINSRYMTPTGYGMIKHRHLFTDRQLVALTTFSNLVAEARLRVLKDAWQRTSLNSAPHSRNCSKD